MNFVINNVFWNVRFISPNSNLLRRSDGSITIGVTDRNKHQICIANNIYGALLKKVLCHEIVHSAIFSYGIDLSVEQEELVADLIATYGSEIIDITNRLFERLMLVA